MTTSAGGMKLLDRVIETLIGLILVALVVTAFGQVVARYVFARPFTWVLEADIFLMVLAPPVGPADSAHLRTRCGAKTKGRHALRHASPNDRSYYRCTQRQAPSQFTAVWR